MIDDIVERLRIHYWENDNESLLINEAMDEIRSLRSELLALKSAVSWQLIDSAPKDGSHFLGAEYWDDKWWYEEIWYSHTWGFGGGNFLSKPTHWMPLPSPPRHAINVKK